MKELNVILTELGISKVRLAKYLGVSRQMLYNYLGIENINDWPKEKAAKVLSLLNIESIDELSNIKVTGEYIIEVENRLNEGVKDSSSKEVLADLKGFNKKEQELLSDIINLLKEKLASDKTKDTYIGEDVEIFLNNSFYNELILWNLPLIKINNLYLKVFCLVQ